MYIYIYPPPCPWATKWSALMPLRWSEPSKSLFVMFLKGPQPGLLACSSQLFFFIDFSISVALPFFPIFDRFWSHLGPILASKIDQRSTENRSQIQSFFWCLSFLIFGPNLMDFWSILGPKIDDFGPQNRCQEDMKTTRSNKTKISQKYEKHEVFYTFWRFGGVKDR